MEAAAQTIYIVKSTAKEDTGRERAMRDRAGVSGPDPYQAFARGDTLEHLG